MASNALSDLNEDIFRIFLTEIVLVKNYGFKVIPKFEEDKECPICADELKGKPVLIPPCGCEFDYTCLMECIVTHKMQSCPMCKIDDPESKYEFMQEENFTYPVPEKKTTEDNPTPSAPKSLAFLQSLGVSALVLTFIVLKESTHSMNEPKFPESSTSFVGTFPL